MINKELKRLSRRELVDIIYQLKKNEQELQEKNDALIKELEDKRIKISESGNIAEAAVNITDVFNVAQTTADLYLQEISVLKEKTEKECAKMIEEANKKVEIIFASGQKQFDDLNDRYQEEYKKWQQIKAEVKALEQTKKEGIEDGK